MPPLDPRRLAALVPLFASLLPAQQHPVFDGPGKQVRLARTLGGHVPELDATLASFHGLDLAQATTGQLAWVLLACSGNGSTLRSGAQRDLTKRGLTVLRDRARPDHRFARTGSDASGEVAPRAECLLAALAVRQLHHESDYKLIGGLARRSVTAALEELSATDAPPPTELETVLLAVLARSFRDFPTGSPEPDPELETCERLVREAAQRLASGRSRRDDAAAHCASVLLGEQHVPELTIAKCWPADLARDPLHTLAGSLAIRDLDVDTRSTLWRGAAELLARRDAAGAWRATGDHDAVATNAMFVLALGVSLPVEPTRRDD